MPTCHHQFQDSKHCLHCGISFETLRQQNREELLRFGDVVASGRRTVEEDLARLQSTLSSDALPIFHACEALISAIAAGATLVFAGPTESGGTFGATLESATGARCANAYGRNLRDVVVELIREWQGQLNHATPPGHVATVVDGSEESKTSSFTSRKT